MRKKIIIGIAASLFAVAGLFGVNTMNQNASSDISLSSIAVMAQAQAEGVQVSCNCTFWGTCKASGRGAPCGGGSNFNCQSMNGNC